MNLKLTIAYDGSPFLGWQSQCHGNSVQDIIEGAFSKILGKDLVVHGASRTDRGVHALAQVAHVKIEEVSKKINHPDCLKRALNASLPPQIRILRVQKAPATFHARFDAKSKIYSYRLWHDDLLPPHLYQRSWHIYGQLDLSLLEEIGSALLGRHDFRGFTTKSGSMRRNTIRTLYALKIIKRGRDIRFFFHGDGFLYHMIRILVGSMIAVARGRASISSFLERLHHAQPSSLPSSAPAQGLYLVHVFYKKQAVVTQLPSWKLSEG